MALTAASVIDRVREQLIDTGSSPRWTDTELLRFLSDGERTIVSIDPSATMTVATVQLTAGSRQSLPADSNALIRIDCNMGTSGTSPGKSVRVIRREVMDAYRPDWQGASKTIDIENYMFDPHDETAYYVYPPSNGNGYVRILYSAQPTELVATTDGLNVADIYIPALFDYVMHRAHLKDSDFAAGQAQADYYYKSFTRFLVGENKGDIESNPNLETEDFDARSRGTAK